MLFLLFLNDWLILFFPEVIAQIFNPISELIIPKRKPTIEAKAKNEKAEDFNIYIY